MTGTGGPRGTIGMAGTTGPTGTSGPPGTGGPPGRNDLIPVNYTSLQDEDIMCTHHHHPSPMYQNIPYLYRDLYD